MIDSIPGMVQVIAGPRNSFFSLSRRSVQVAVRKPTITNTVSPVSVTSAKFTGRTRILPWFDWRILEKISRHLF